MENSICNFHILQNPNRRYAKTVNIAFFKAIPATKNFSIYINGLRRWKEYKKLFPDCQIQFFIDDYVSKNSEFMKQFEEIGARVYKFECPDYLRNDNFHIGLFGTLLRFFPAFDINTHPLTVAHIQELEPNTDDDIKHLTAMNSITNKQLDLTFVYASFLTYEQTDSKQSQSKIDGYMEYPYIFAGRCSFKRKVPFSLYTNFLKHINSGKKFQTRYAYKKPLPEHGKYSYGVDEIFLNQIILQYLIKSGEGIGILLHYVISQPLYSLADRVSKHPKTVEYLSYILNEEHTSVSSSMKSFDKLFYRTPNSDKAKECASRFYEVLERAPEWLGENNSAITVNLFKGYTERHCVIIVKNNKIEKIVDL